jgi:NitT/TauT family transport system substrate-binding protein
VRFTGRRTTLWALALAGVLAVVAVVYGSWNEDDDDNAQPSGEPPSQAAPQLPDDVGDGCGSAGLTDAADLDGARPVARCAAGYPEPRPLGTTAARLRVAVTQRSEAAAPVLVADRLGEFAAEGLDVEIVDQRATEAFAALAAGDVDVVAGPVDAPFFDAVNAGAGARWVLGGTLSTAPGDTDVPQAGLWFRSELVDRRGGQEQWNDLAGMTMGLDAGWRSAAVYPVATVTAQGDLSLNDVDLVAVAGDQAVDRLLDGKLAAAWIDQPAWTRVADSDGFELAATLPATEPIDGTMMSNRLLGSDREVGLAYARAVIRTINTYLTGDYHQDDDVMTALADAIGNDADELAATPALLFDWEIRAGTTARLQDALVELGGVAYERPLAERDLVDRTIALDATRLRPR